MQENTTVGGESGAIMYSHSMLKPGGILKSIASKTLTLVFRKLRPI